MPKHFYKQTQKFNKLSESWGVSKDKVDYDLLGEKLLTAVSKNNDQDLETFFMLLPKLEQDKILSELEKLRNILDKKIDGAKLDSDILSIMEQVKDMPQERGILETIKQTHSQSSGKKQFYTAKEQLKFLIVTFGAQALMIANKSGLI